MLIRVGKNQLVGDMLCLGGAVLFSITTVLQELTVKTVDIIEYLGMIGFFGTILCCAQTWVKKKKDYSPLWLNFLSSTFLQGCAWEHQVGAISVEQCAGDYVLSGVLHHAVRVFLFGACYIVRIRCNSVATGTTHCRLVQCLIRHVDTPIQGTSARIHLWFNVPFFKLSNTFKFCTLQQHERSTMRINRLVQPVPVSRIVLRLVYAHNDRYIHLRDKENTNVDELAKTAHGTDCSRLQVMFTIRTSPLHNWIRFIKKYIVEGKKEKYFKINCTSAWKYYIQRNKKKNKRITLKIIELISFT